jgi:hypothetical protein
MPLFLIERRIPEAGEFTPSDLHDIAVKSNGVVQGMQRDGKAVQWVQSFVTDDTIHCVWMAPNAEAVREHARSAGFPADQVMAVRAVIDPTTGE